MLRSCIPGVDGRGQLCMQAMGSSKVKDIEQQIENMHDWGYATYYGESLEVLANLQMQPSYLSGFEA